MRQGRELFSVHMKWYGDYWDGPLSGICKYDGKIYYFECCEEEDTVEIDWDTNTVENGSYDRFFNLRCIPWWRICYQFASHFMFRLLVQRIYTKWSMLLWYKTYSLRFNYDKCAIVGWCADDKEFFRQAEKKPKRWIFE